MCILYNIAAYYFSDERIQFKVIIKQEFILYNITLYRILVSNLPSTRHDYLPYIPYITHRTTSQYIFAHRTPYTPHRTPYSTPFSTHISITCSLKNSSSYFLSELSRRGNSTYLYVSRGVSFTIYAHTRHPVG